LDRFPEARGNWAENGAADNEMATLQEIIVSLRNIRAEMKLDPKKRVAAEFSSRGLRLRNLVQENMDPLLRLASLSELRVSADHLDPRSGAVRSTAAFDLRIAYTDAVDKPAEIARLKKEIARLENDIESKQKRLADESFTSKAPGQVVDALRATMVERQIERQKLQDRLDQLL
jgi:valyl-tRNA synthetase